MLCKLISVRLRGLVGKLSGKGGKWLGLFVFIVLGFAVASLGVGLYFLFSSIGELVHGTPLAWFFFALVGLLSFGVSFFFTAFAAKSELFEAKDNEMLLALPIKPRTILLSRLSILLLSEYPFSFLIMIPAGIAWGVLDGIGFLPCYILGCLFLPLLTAGLASIVGWLLALLTANAKRKNLMTVIFSLAFMGVYMYFYTNMDYYVNQIISMHESLSESMVGWGFLFHWFGLGVADGDIIRLLAAIAISVAVFLLAIWAISHGFLRVSGSSSSHSKKKIRYDGSSVGKALYVREMKRLLSCPVYMLNCGIGMIMILIIAVFLLIKGDALQTLLAAIPFSATWIYLLCGLLISFLTSMCSFTAASISLEGKQLWILRSAPIEAQKILKTKIFFHLSLTAPCFLVLSVAVALVFEASFGGWVIILLLPQLMNALCAQFGLMMNLLFPKFEWTNENEPVKQSLSTFLSMMLPILLPGGIVMWMFLAEVNVNLLLPVVFGLLILLNLLCAMWLRSKGSVRFDRLF